ncbi:MAG: hypothetical protein ACE5JK_01350 [Candidatus Omnitrophota bacterium]
MRKKFLLILLTFSLSVFAGCVSFAPAPIKDGAYLKYELRSKDFTGSCKIVFKQVNNTYFEVIADDPDGLLGRPFAKPNRRDGKVMVNRWMKRRGGRPLELEQLGPIWVPPAERARGGRAGIDLVFSGTFEDEITQWKGWEVYKVTATIFRGAFSGTWYYDRTTGFLVGHERKTVATSFFTKTPPYFILIDSNIEGLLKKAPQAPEEAAPEAEEPEIKGDVKTILLKNGGIIEGVITTETDSYVIVEFAGASITINKENIKSID